MQISKIQNNQVRPAFKSYTITPQAKALVNSPEKFHLTQKAEKLFGNSRHIDFNIGDNFVPTVNIKETGEKLIGDLQASLTKGINCLRISDKKTNIDIIVPKSFSAETLQDRINNGFKDSVSKAVYVGEIIKMTAEDHSGRFLI